MEPGMAIVELFAWMTELLVIRVNQVPRLSYLSSSNWSESNRGLLNPP